MAAPSCRFPDQGPTEIRIGHAPHDHHAPLFIAASNPLFFKEHGGIYLEETAYRRDYRLIANGRALAEVHIDSTTGGKELIRQLSEGYFDLSLGGAPAMLDSIDRGNRIKILAPINAGGAGFAVRRSLPFDDWAGFISYLSDRSQPFRVGYKIAVSVQGFIFEQALEASQASFSRDIHDAESDVVLLNLYGANNLLPALTNGLIDGFVIMQPYLAAARRSGEVKVIARLEDLPPHGAWRRYPCCALAGNENFLATHPEETEAMVALLLQARRFIIGHPARSAAQTAKWLGTSPAVEIESMASIDFSGGIDKAWFSGLNKWVDSMIESGALTGEVKRAREAGRISDLLYDKSISKKATELKDQ